MDGNNAPVGIGQWLGEILAAAMIGIGVTGAWFKDRLAINNRINAVEARIASIETKLDMLITLHVTDKATNEQ